MDIRIVSVNVGFPQQLTLLNGKVEWSSIAKQPVAVTDLLLTWTNLQGDQQVDTRPKADGTQLHGGNEKAVYVYPSEHLPQWQDYLMGQKLGPGAFGENLLIAGALESDVHIGDIWAWGDARLEVSKPRQPCYKLAAYLQAPGIIDQMKQNGCCGWYMKVLQPGMVRARGGIEVVSRNEAGPSVLTRFWEKTRSKA